MSFDIFDTDSIVTGGIAFSGGNLTATCSTGALSASRIAQAKEGKTAGKWYVEFTCGGVSGNVDGVGIVPSFGVGGAQFIGDVESGVTFDQGWGYYTNSHVVNQGGVPSSVNSTTWGNGDVIGLAIDLDNKRLWFTKNGGAWVGTSGTPNPATNTSGFDISDMLARSQHVYPAANMSGNGAIFTANFGATAFTGSVPAGFTSGWTNTAVAYCGTFATNGFGQYVNAPPQNDVAVSKYTSNFTGKVDHFVIPYASQATANLKGVIYSDNAGVPNALLGVSPTIASSGGGEVTFDFSAQSVSLTNGTAYWFGVISDQVASLGNNRTEGAGTSAAGIYFVADTYASPSLTFPGSPSTVNFRYPIKIFPATASVETGTALLAFGGLGFAALGGIHSGIGALSFGPFLLIAVGSDITAPIPPTPPTPVVTNRQRVDPLAWNVPITNKDGSPTPEFQRKWDKQASVNGGIVPQPYIDGQDAAQLAASRGYTESYGATVLVAAQAYTDSKPLLPLTQYGGGTVAELPVSASLGDMAVVNDATAPTYLGVLVGGGTVTTPVFYNGTAWVSH